MPSNPIKFAACSKDGVTLQKICLLSASSSHRSFPNRHFLRGRVGRMFISGLFDPFDQIFGGASYDCHCTCYLKFTNKANIDRARKCKGIVEKTLPISFFLKTARVWRSMGSPVLLNYLVHCPAWGDGAIPKLF